MTPRGFLLRAAVIVAAYGALEWMGGRADAGFLSGTPVPHVLLGCAYVVLYFLSVLAAPILVIAAGLWALAGRR